MAAPRYKVDSQAYANFAAASRLVSCLVSEGLRPAYFLPVTSSSSCSSSPSSSSSSNLIGAALLLSRTTERLEAATLASDVLAVVPLRSLPILDPKAATNSVNGARRFPQIQLVDPWEMIAPNLFVLRILHRNQNLGNAIHNGVEHEQYQHLKFMLAEASGAAPDTIILEAGLDALQLWSTFAWHQKLDPELIDELSRELQSSIDYQKMAYDHPKILPTLESSSIEWEQCILEAHPTHPMHKMRKSYPPKPPLTPGMIDLENPRLYLVSFPREAIQLRGDFEAAIHGLVEHMLSCKPDPKFVYMPVHEFQLDTLLEKFPMAQAVHEARPLRAHGLMSVRTVALPKLFPGKTLKLCLNLKITATLRTIMPITAYFGPGFSEKVVPHLCYDRDVLTIQRELATAVARHDDPHVAKHASCLVREALEYGPESERDLIVPCASLVERIQRPDTDTTLVTHVFGLATESKRQEFLRRYIDLIVRAFLPPAVMNGVAFEAHGQNVLARFDRRTGELKGFLIRDFGGIRVHRPTLRASTGVDIDVLPGNSVEAKAPSDVLQKLYHSLFHLHLQRLIRVLDQHINGFGWRCVREALERNVTDHGSELYKLLRTQEVMQGKCLVRMKMAELYRDYIYSPVPNLILYEPQAVAPDGSVYRNLKHIN
ncbi:hypothetical protein BDZ91DRAFT_701712 [Kalaharituber pfeilii]|nr:hypothetical protein BDZ91DRAFT_701712 [Kalaharituber pfeilii]